MTHFDLMVVGDANPDTLAPSRTRRTAGPRPWSAPGPRPWAARRRSSRPARPPGAGHCPVRGGRPRRCRRLRPGRADQRRYRHRRCRAARGGAHRADGLLERTWRRPCHLYRRRRAGIVRPAAAAAARHVHAASLFLQPRLAERLTGLFGDVRFARAGTSLDTNHGPSGRWTLAPGLVAACDYLLPSEAEALSLTGTPTVLAALEHLAEAGTVPVVKRGRCGSRRLRLRGAVHTRGRRHRRTAGLGRSQLLRRHPPTSP